MKVLHKLQAVTLASQKVEQFVFKACEDKALERNLNYSLKSYLALRASCRSSGQTQASLDVRLMTQVGGMPLPPLGPLALWRGLTFRELK